MCVAIVFPFSVDDKESNSSSGGDGKSKATSSTHAASVAGTSNNSSSKNVNNNPNDSSTVDKSNSTNKSSAMLTPSGEQSVTTTTPSSGARKSSDSVSDASSKCNLPTKTNNCDENNSKNSSNVLDANDIKVEIKQENDPETLKGTKSTPVSVNHIQPALGSSILPPHAANSKHPVSKNFNS